MAYEGGQSDASISGALTLSKSMKAIVKKSVSKHAAVTKAINNIFVGPCNTELEISFYTQKLAGLHSEIVDMDNKIETHLLKSQLWSDGKHTRQAEISETYIDSMKQNMIMLESRLKNLSMPALPEPT